MFDEKFDWEKRNAKYNPKKNPIIQKQKKRANFCHCFKKAMKSTLINFMPMFHFYTPW